MHMACPGVGESARKALTDMQFAFVQSMALSAAVKLNIADIIAEADGQDATLTAAEIGAKLPTASSKLSVANFERLLRYLVLQNVFRAEHGDGTSAIRYGLTPLSELLVSSAPQSMVPIVKMQLHTIFVTPWLHLDEAVLDGGVEPFTVANDGKNVWDLTKEDGNVNDILNEAMGSFSKSILDIVLPAYQGFKDVQVVADVGGGIGLCLREIIKHNPHLKGINFDLPNVIATAPEIPGVIHVGGDMFESVPHADAIHMKWVLHDWSDERCIHILKNCWKALPEKGGKVVLVEEVVPPNDHEDLDELRHASQNDLIMLAHTIGKERTALEWQAIFTAAGFSTLKYHRFSGDFAFPGCQYIIEAFK